MANNLSQQRWFNHKLREAAAKCPGCGQVLGLSLSAADRRITCPGCGRKFKMPALEHLNAPKEHDRLRTDPDMRLCGLTNAWALGDCAWILNAYDDQPCAPTGQFAERQGRQAGENIFRAIHKQPTRPFYFKPLGQLCSIGGHKAVAEILGFRMSGFLAWLLWRGIYLFKLPSWSRRTGTMTTARSPARPTSSSNHQAAGRT